MLAQIIHVKMEVFVKQTEIHLFVLVQHTIPEYIVKHVKSNSKLINFLKKSNFSFSIDTNVCSFNTCLNGGSCQPTGVGNGFICICQFGYSGTYCQTSTIFSLNF